MSQTLSDKTYDFEEKCVLYFCWTPLILVQCQCSARVHDCGHWSVVKVGPCNHDQDHTQQHRTHTCGDQDINHPSLPTWDGSDGYWTVSTASDILLTDWCWHVPRASSRVQQTPEWITAGFTTSCSRLLQTELDLYSAARHSKYRFFNHFLV